MKPIELKTIKLTREYLSRFWQRDYKFAANYFADDITWIGSRQEQFIIEKKNVEADFDCDTQEMQSCHLLNAELHIVVSASKVCVITVRCNVTTD